MVYNATATVLWYTMRLQLFVILKVSPDRIKLKKFWARHRSQVSVESVQFVSQYFVCDVYKTSLHVLY